jgi:PAS domain S-box-containing protein
MYLLHGDIKIVKDQNKVIVLSIIAGIILWIIDALIDSFFFSHKTFLNSLLFQVSDHRFIHRTLFLVFFIAFGVIISRFITKHKNIEKKLTEAISNVKEEKAKTDSIIAAIGNGLSIQDTNFKILYQNQVHKDLIGDHKGEYCYSAYEKRDHLCDGCPLDLSFKNGGIYRAERSVSDNGKMLHVEITASPIRDASGKIVAGIEVVRDISHHKWAEELIRMSKQDWIDTFDTIDDIITVHDNNFNIIKTNKAAESAFGISVKEIVKSKCFSVFHGKDTPPDDCPSCTCMDKGKPITNEYYEPHLKKYLEIKAIPRLDPYNKPLGIIHIVRDITNRKKMENELINHRKHLTELVKEKTSDLTSAINLLNNEIASRKYAEDSLRISEKKYRDLYNNAPDMYHTLNKDKIIIDCNETEAEMLGYRKEEIIGRPVTDFLTEESRLLTEQYYSELKRDTVLKNMKRTFVRKDGTIFPAIINVYADFDENGQIITTSAIARDITELQRAEAEALRAAHLASLGELAAGVAHEINNPINGIINYAELISKKSAKESKERNISERIIMESERIASIVGGLLAFARDNREEKTDVSINEILSDTFALTEAQLDRDGIHINNNMTNGLPHLLAQPHQIEQVFLNIISNARFALNQRYPGKHPNKVLDISGSKIIVNDRSYVRIRFRDHGTGIPDEIKDQIMNPFFSTKPAKKGTGLGLSISHGIVNNHGGNIRIKSVPGKFTEIIIEIPTYERKQGHEE